MYLPLDNTCLSKTACGQLGNQMKILIIGNISNNAYLLAKFLREKYCPDCPVIQATPDTICDVLRKYINIILKKCPLTP